MRVGLLSPFFSHSLVPSLHVPLGEKQSSELNQIIAWYRWHCCKSVCYSKKFTWFTRLFLLMRWWGLGTRLLLLIHLFVHLLFHPLPSPPYHSTSFFLPSYPSFFFSFPPPFPFLLLISYYSACGNIVSEWDCSAFFSIPSSPLLQGTPSPMPPW